MLRIGDNANTQLNEHDQQVAHDWYNKNQAHPPAGLRNQDRLSAAEESRLDEGAVLDKNLRRKVHPALPIWYVNCRRLPVTIAMSQWEAIWA